ncbi:hypothetical protein HOY80DRAFT_869723, partial [Tuber brumale]
SLSDLEFIQLCRFSSQDIFEITQCLRLPPIISTRNRNSFTQEEAFFLFCARLAYPQRIEQMAIYLDYSAKRVSESYGWMLEYIWKSWDHLLCDFQLPAQHLSPERLQYFARKIHGKGAPLTTCWGFIDCTIRPICRPVKWQKRVYNGHKKKHSLKYSAV